MSAFYGFLLAFIFTARLLLYTHASDSIHKLATTHIIFL